MKVGIPKPTRTASRGSTSRMWRRIFTDDLYFFLKADHDGKSHAGRIYTVKYFAKDVSGNKTFVSSVVTVPHDRRKHEERRDKDGKKG